MKRQTLVIGVMSLTAVSMFTSCVDDKYDLTDIDTTSRFTVDDLTVPINVSEIKLENVISLDDNENISKIEFDGKECYAISKGGSIETDEFTIDGVKVNKLDIDPTLIPINIAQNIPSLPVEFPLELDIPTNLNRPAYKFEMNNVDDALKSLTKILTVNDIEIKVVLSLPSELIGNDNTISFKNIQLQLPWGLILDENKYAYSQDSGLLEIEELPVESNGTATISLKAKGLDLGDKGNVINHYLAISGNVGVISGKIDMILKNIAVPAGNYNITASYEVSGFELASFSGNIEYKMDQIDIAPISLKDLPDFLDSPDTELIIANPQILIGINNPVGNYGLKGTGVISLTSNFKGGFKKPSLSDPFVIEGNHSNIAFCTSKNGYEYVQFDGLRTILTSGDKNVGGLPESISVNIHDIVFAGNVKDFPLGNIGKADGTYEFTAPLGFGENSKVIYETSVDGWSSDDLDDVNITKIHVKANCTTNLPVGVYLTLQPIDKKGNVIAVKEESSLSIDPKCNKAPIAISLEGANGPIHGFDGIKFKATVSQNSPQNTEALGPDLLIKLDDIRVTVDGYYETDF